MSLNKLNLKRVYIVKNYIVLCCFGILSLLVYFDSCDQSHSSALNVLRVGCIKFPSLCPCYHICLYSQLILYDKRLPRLNFDETIDAT